MPDWNRKCSIFLDFGHEEAEWLSVSFQMIRKNRTACVGTFRTGVSHFTSCWWLLAEEVAVSPFVRRVNRLTGMKEPCFFRNGHRERFFMMLGRCIHKSEEPALCAAIYLLSADRFLWGRALYAVDQDEIQFSEIHIHGVDLDGYVLFYMARDLYRGSQHISLSELIDPELVSDQVFERIVTACLIRRYGSVVLQEGLQ